MKFAAVTSWILSKIARLVRQVFSDNPRGQYSQLKSINIAFQNMSSPVAFNPRGGTRV